MIGTSELILIFGTMIFIFGANKIPKIGGALGEGILNFKKGMKPKNQ